ncbi:MAG: hypothetical protein RJA55_1452 [Acidobacteriota bacterium]
MADSDDLKLAREQYDDADATWSDARAQWVEDVRFARLGEQWPDQVKRQRERDGRPCLTINRLPSFIRQVVNDARQNKPAIKIHPVDSGADIETAEVLGGLVRQIEASSNADVAYDTALEHAVSGGFGFFRVGVAYAHGDSFDQSIVIEAIVNPITVRWDAASTAADAGDWRYAFVVDEIPKPLFEQQYRGAEAVDWDSDAPDYADGWLNEDSVRVAEWWTREEAKRTILRLSDGSIIGEDKYLRVVDGVPAKAIYDSRGIVVVGTREARTHAVRQRIITGAETLSDVAWSGRYIPICPVYGEDITVEGRRHFISMTRQARDPQRNFNYWRSAATELVALAPKAPFIGPKGSFNTDRSRWQTANIESHPYLEYDGATPPQRQPFAGVPAGALQEAMNASDDMKSIMGLHDASLGARSNETSGRAIMARQREGDTSTFHFIDNLSRGIRYAGRVIVDLIPSVYNAPRMLRVIGADQTKREVQINTDGAFDLTAGVYDVTVDVGPAFTSRREESMNGMLEMLRVYPPAAPLLGDLIAKAADWPNSDEVAKRLKSMLPTQILQAEAQDMPPQAQAMMAGMTTQMQQMQQGLQAHQQQLQEARAALQQMAQENAMLKIQGANRSGELQLKARELEIKEGEIVAKAQTEQAKAAAGVEETRIEAMAEQIVARIEAQTAMLSQQVGAVEQRMVEAPERESGDGGTDAAMKMAMMHMLSKMANTGPKTLTIQAPSGGTYQAVITDQAVQITAPSGQVYTGRVSQGMQ